MTDDPIRLDIEALFRALEPRAHAVNIRVVRREGDRASLAWVWSDAHHVATRYSIPSESELAAMASLRAELLREARERRDALDKAIAVAAKGDEGRW